MLFVHCVLPFARLLDKRFDTETKTICTQTPIEAIPLDEKNHYDNKLLSDANHFAPSCVHFKEKKLSVFRCIDEDPAPQCLIEKALARGTEVCKEYVY